VWIDLTEKTFNFATNARQAFINGDMHTKKEILMALGQNPTIKDGILSVQANEWLQPIANEYPALEKEYLRLEPNKTTMNKTQKEAFASVRAQWGGVVKNVGKVFKKLERYICIPELNIE